MKDIDQLQKDAVALLKKLIATRSFSKEEDKTAAILEDFFVQSGIPHQRHINNVWAINKHFDSAKPTVLLNSHHDTVKPNPKYTIDPYTPLEKDGKIFGLGSNDAGGCLVSLIATFRYFYAQENLPFNVVMACSAEEEISGADGIEALLNFKGFLDSVDEVSFKEPKKHWCGIVGEPTQTQLAVAEKGLLVLDVTAHGKAGHAARSEGVNALYRAVKEIEWFRTHHFDKKSEWLGKVKMTVTSINTENKQHNVVPDSCHYVVDIRIPDCYAHEDILEIIRDNIESEIKPRNFRLKSSSIPVDHPIVASGMSLGRKPFGSPTCSDKAFMQFPALKCGPGDSARSHTADEYIFVEEINDGIKFYIDMLNNAQF